ncbi:MAG: four helix bundle protein [bacterium]
MGRDYRNIKAWQMADALAISVYSATSSFPKSETFGLTSQLRRAAVSVPVNIVEGSARNHPKEYIHFIYTALGSLAEVGYLLDFSHRIGYIKNGGHEKFVSQHEQTMKTLRGLINYLESEGKH